MTQFDVHAISLKTTPFQETHMVVSFYTAEHGEVRAVAKGVKRATSKLAGACEALTLNHVYLARGKSLDTLCHYDRLHSFNAMRGDLERMAAATACTEVVRILGRENDPDSHAVYHLLASTLGHFDDTGRPWVQTSLQFHLQMLKLAGYLPWFTHCVSCESALDLFALRYFPFYLSHGGFLCRACATAFSHVPHVDVSTRTMRLLGNPEALEDEEATPKAHRFLAYYWGQRLERPLKSFDFLFQLLPSAG